MQQEPDLKLVFSCHYPRLVFKDYMQIMPVLPSALPPFYFLSRLYVKSCSLFRTPWFLQQKKPKPFPKVEFLRISVFYSSDNRNEYEHSEPLVILPGLRRCEEKQSGSGKKSS